MARMNPMRLASALFILVVFMGFIPTSHTVAEGTAPAGKGTIVVPVNNLQNFGKGQLLAILFKKVKRVEVNGVPFYRRAILPVKGKNMTITFKDVPFGEYAIAVMHDMDKDLEMATTPLPSLLFLL